MKMAFITNLRDGKSEMSLTEKDRMVKYFRSLKDGLYDIIISKHKNKRTLK